MTVGSMGPMTTSTTMGGVSLATCIALPVRTDMPSSGLTAAKSPVLVHATAQLGWRLVKFVIAGSVCVEICLA